MSKKKADSIGDRMKQNYEYVPLEKEDSDDV